MSFFAIIAEMNHCRGMFLNWKDGVATSWLLGRFLKVLGSDVAFV